MDPAPGKSRRKILRWCIVVYCLLWVITATWGTRTVDRAFDREIAFGYLGFSDKPEREPAARVPYTSEMQKPNGNWSVSHPLWRARSRGIAVAPFVIVDAAAWVDASLSAFSGYRVTLWCFGASHWFPLNVFWVS
jgi:hypothetical protein